MNYRSASLLLVPLLVCQCSTMKRAGEGMAAVTRPVGSGAKKLASGAKSLAGGATKLWPWKKGSEAGTPDPQEKPAPAVAEEKPLPPGHTFPTSGLLVTDAELGTEPTRYEDTSVTLAEGWTLAGRQIVYRMEPGAAAPAALRITGTPATAKSGSLSASADELHYHAASGVLVLRGNATLSGLATTTTATSPTTQIRIHLPSGAISVTGPARWGS